MRWWRKQRAEARCEVCGKKPAPSEVLREVDELYVSADEQDYYVSTCAACWQRHLELDAAAEARFRAANPVDEVCAALRDDDAFVRMRAGSTLARLRDLRAADALFEAIDREEQRYEFATFAAWDMFDALAAIGGDDVERRLLALLHRERYWWNLTPRDSDNPSIYPAHWVCRALARIGGAEPVVRGLLDVLAGEQPSLRYHAAHELYEVAFRDTKNHGLSPWGDGKLTATARESMVAPLLSVLHDESWLIRDRAVTALGYLGDRRAVDAVVACLADEVVNVRHSAAGALGDLGDRKAIEPLRATLGTDIANAADEALTKLGSPQRQNRSIFRRRTKP